MKASVKVVSCMLFFTLLMAVSCNPPQTTENESVAAGNELAGVWKVAEVTMTGPQAQTITEPEPGICIITKKYVSYVGATAPRAELPENATDAQLAAAFKSFSAIASTYDVNGDTITARSIAQLDPNVKQGDSATMEYTLEGNTLSITVTSEAAGPLENPYTLKFVRVE